eukprot:SAG31_NODE_2825_length_5038_cov_2.170277_1_plen_111_part_00
MCTYELGAHLYYRGAFGTKILTHHAVYTGEDTVIEFGRGEQRDEHGNVLQSTKTEIQNAVVQRNSLAEFEAAAAAAGSRVQIVRYARSRFNPAQIVRRAESRLGEHGKPV